ncbi:dephospho-CoA kinase [Moritella sp. F3]|uniref:dephospho-CoA kinase n=1 Tax=Moritella sp. F3 TaxID=2718882 RepID=UPI0018E15D69|nr:dephospho-CoA kinase [Moritella sp. F3]GIC76152.1 dephospho-CoA kinase [Moritella sp. F1]GIC82745.1 dephospho-CoA kinase [Moritella sp. F3]
MYVVGLTGGIASGKTTVADIIASEGINVVDADIVAREVVAIGSDGLAQISAHFGSSILLDDGSLNRGLLREKIFSDNANKQWLNALLHPLIRAELLAQLAASDSPYTLLVVPLLVENNLTTLCDHVLVVDVAEQVQIERTVARDNVSAQQASAILQSQATRKQRLAAADSVIVNNDRQQVIKDAAVLHQKFLELATAAMAD